MQTGFWVFFMFGVTTLWSQQNSPTFCWDTLPQTYPRCDYLRRIQQ